MISFGNPTETAIIQALAAGPVGTTDLVSRIAAQCHVSAKAVYNALNKLKDAQAIAQTGRQTALYTFWIEDLVDFTQQTQQTYRVRTPVENLLPELSEKSTATYYFDSIPDLDLFWAQVGSHTVPRAEHPTYYIFYGSMLHWWTLHTEHAFRFLHLVQQQNYIPFICYTDSHDRDKQAMKMIIDADARLSRVPAKLIPNNVNGNIIRDTIIDTIYDLDFWNSLTALYDSKSTQDDILKLEQEFAQQKSMRMKISKNQKQATEKAKKLLSFFALSHDEQDLFGINS